MLITRVNNSADNLYFFISFFLKELKDSHNGIRKTIMQLAWADQIHKHKGGMVLIVAPLAVSAQTCREGRMFGIEVTRCRTAADLKDGINITNYEMLAHFEGVDFLGVVLDESSILKSYSGAIRNQIIDMFNANAKKYARENEAPMKAYKIGRVAYAAGEVNGQRDSVLFED